MDRNHRGNRESKMKGKHMPIISIIVPVYNVECYIERCVDSLINQSFNDLEIILVDDGSQDKSGIICDSYIQKDSRIRVIHKDNGGLSSARNAGINIAKGDYIGFVDSDDWVAPFMFEYLYTLIINYSAEIASISYVLSDSKTVLDKNKRYYVNVFNRQQALHYYLYIGMKKRIADYSVCIKLYSKSLFNNIKFPEGQIYEDVVTNFRLLQLCNRYVKSTRQCYYYNQEGNSIIRDSLKKRDLIAFAVADELIQLAKVENSQDIILLSKMKYARTYLSLLLKASIYGVNKEIVNSSELLLKLKLGLRRNLILLLKSPMPFSRKLAAIILAIDYNLISKPIWFFRKKDN